MSPTSEQIAIVKSTAPIVKEHGEKITNTFYRNLLNDHPALHNYFSVRNQQTGAQQTALAAAVFAYATYIDNLSVLSSAVEKIANKHASLFVKPEHYPIVGEYLIGALGEVLGDALTPDIKEAWVAAYNQLAQVFIDAEKGLYESAGEWDSWRPFQIVQKIAETESITSIYLKPTDHKQLPAYTPGQYVSVQIALPKLDGLLQSRQFSLSEGPVSGVQCYRISVKNENFGNASTEADMASGKSPGLVSTMLHDHFFIGDKIHLSPPRGVFGLAEDSTEEGSSAPVVLISVGVGATPLLPMLERVLDIPNNSHPVVWAHGARKATAVCYREHIKELSKRSSNLTHRIFVKNVEKSDKKGEDYDKKGRLDMSVLKGSNDLHLEDPKTHYYICGPEEFMLQVQDFLKGESVSDHRIHIELFRTGGL